MTEFVNQTFDDHVTGLLANASSSANETYGNWNSFDYWMEDFDRVMENNLSAKEYTVDDFVAMALLAIFTVTGTIGNALVLFVYSGFNQKRTSTIFILTLASNDLIVSVIIMPYRLATELIRIAIDYDLKFICNITSFLATTVLFSVFVMVLIAVDRYLCICHTFLHMRVMTAGRARLIVVLLTVLVIILAVLNSIGTGHDWYLQSGKPLWDDPELVYSMFYLYDVDGGCSRYDVYYTYIEPISYLICVIIIIIMYSMIYRSLQTRMRMPDQTQTIPNHCCAVNWRCCQNKNKMETGRQGTEAHTKGPSGAMLKPARKSIYRDKRDKLQNDNLRATLMLAVVALVFIVAKLPKLVTHFVSFNYRSSMYSLYFMNNVANPVIYAFTNPTFRDNLKKKLCKCSTTHTVNDHTTCTSMRQLS
jgi:cholecystokinin A receptor